MDRVGGRNTVLEALIAKRKIYKIFVASGIDENDVTRRIFSLAREQKVPVIRVDKKYLNTLTSTRHQGVVALCAEHGYGYTDIEEILRKLKEGGKAPFLLILDELEDPHNLGAILRSADGAGVDGIIIPKRHSAGLTPVVAKVSAGAIEYVQVARVVNIATAIHRLKDDGIRIIGASEDAKNVYFEVDMRGAVALVIGGEGRGIRRLVKEKCDLLVRIPMRGHISCLNASVATSLLIYEKLRQDIFQSIKSDERGGQRST
ncbi:MAG: 23S rRNA (guanosine(2251)-2'-O)-methyltransferase RlmB [Methanophagales archaeon]|nr:23S rRNA (guanosine(2251)-2'-O)-methyltransferase RlmB [Methanophagales archaeon]